MVGSTLTLTPAKKYKMPYLMIRIKKLRPKARVQEGIAVTRKGENTTYPCHQTIPLPSLGTHDFP
jgi:hypothetical protein